MGRSAQKSAGKNIDRARKQVEARPYKLEEAAELLRKVHYVKFDETVELVLNLGVDSKQSDQMVRGTVVLPHGLGKSKRVVVIAGGDKDSRGAGSGRGFRGRRRHGGKDSGRLDGLRSCDRDAGHDALRRQTGKSAGAARPDAESEDWHGDDGRG